MDAAPLALAFLCFVMVPFACTLIASLLLAGRGNRLIVSIVIVPMWCLLSWLTSRLGPVQITLWNVVQPWLVAVVVTGAAYGVNKSRQAFRARGKP